jgi:hypothetical protein
MALQGTGDTQEGSGCTSGEAFTKFEKEEARKKKRKKKK